MKKKEAGRNAGGGGGRRKAQAKKISYQPGLGASAMIQHRGAPSNSVWGAAKEGSPRHPKHIMGK